MENRDRLNVTATVSTRNRYFTTLPLCLYCIAAQIYPPSEIIIYDDNDADKRIDLRNESIYLKIFRLFEYKGIEWKVLFGKAEGQVKNHQNALISANNEYIWRLDDDNAPNFNVLETLVKNIKPKTGAIGGLVICPRDMPSSVKKSSKIEDIYTLFNEQWVLDEDRINYKLVDHLYSSFLFKKDAASHGYEQTLSKVGHREETIFTYEMKRKGWDVVINTNCITWHFHIPSGGIRDNNSLKMWDDDEEIFKRKLKEWEINNDKNDFYDVVLDNGIGDHYVFKMILPDIIKKYKNINLYCCFPEIFEDDNVNLYSISDALNKYNSNILQFNIYKWMDDVKWGGTLLEAFKKMYL